MPSVYGALQLSFTLSPLYNPYYQPMLTNASYLFAFLDLPLVGHTSKREIIESEAHHQLRPQIEYIEQTQEQKSDGEQLLEICAYQGDRVLHSQEPMKGRALHVDDLQEVEAEGRRQLGQEVC